MVAAAHNQLLPFNRDRLFTSIHDSCRHRAASVDDASALTQTVISELMRNQNGEVIATGDIIRTAHTVLQRFDAAAATFYAAYHPEVPEAKTIS